MCKPWTLTPVQSNQEKHEGTVVAWLPAEESEHYPDGDDKPPQVLSQPSPPRLLKDVPETPGSKFRTFRIRSIPA